MTNQPAPSPEGFLRNASEREATEIYAQAYEQSADSTTTKLAHVVKYIRRQDLTRLLARYEIFKKVLKVKGSIIECGVFRGSGLMSWANFSAILEPNNLTRRIYGFDSFEGFPKIGSEDASNFRTAQKGELRSDCFQELTELIRAYDLNRFLGHIPKVELIRGDAVETIPAFVKRNPHLLASLLFMDFDLFDPTKVALEHFLPRMPKGAVLSFDELDNPVLPCETLAMLKSLTINQYKFQRLVFDPYIAFGVLE